MTREEARQKIIDIIDWYVQDALERMCLEIDVDEYYDALDTLYDGPRGNLISRDDAIAAVTMAALEDKDEIEALKAIPSVQVSVDLISRADAIEAVGKLLVDGQTAKVDGKFVPLHFALMNTLSALPSAVCDDCIWTVCNYNKVDWDTPSAEAVTHGRLIDADALSEKLCETTIFIKDGEVFQSMINDAPTVSAEAVQGEWGHMIADGTDGSHWYEYECSHCGEVVLRPYNFCPNCGARMKGGDKDD